jgi:thymidine kinase
MSQYYGCLHIIIGPMCSGKSSELIRELTRYADIGMKVLYVNYVEDVRDDKYDTIFSTHSSQYKGKKFTSQNITAIKVKHLNDIDETIEDYDIIGIDECQFFTDIIDVVPSLVNKKRKVVYCAGLDGDFNQNVFGKTLFLIPYADSCRKLNAKCSICLKEMSNKNSSFIGKDKLSSINDAPFTNKFGGSEEQKQIGGLDIYSPVCRYHLR